MTAPCVICQRMRSIAFLGRCWRCWDYTGNRRQLIREHLRNPPVKEVRTSPRPRPTKSTAPRPAPQPKPATSDGFRPMTQEAMFRECLKGRRA